MYGASTYLIFTTCPSYYTKQTTHSVALLKAAENGHTETVKTLLEKGANVNYQDKVSVGTMHPNWHVTETGFKHKLQSTVIEWADLVYTNISLRGEETFILYVTNNYCSVRAICC